MFYYVSFLRPPPTHAGLVEPILVTPQISNDLRTEHCGAAVDVFYSWALASSSSPCVATAPAKLTTWTRGRAYKEIAVPRPAGVRSGQAWRLVLSAGPAGRDQSVPLAEHGIGRTPLPVVSMPVHFSARPPPATHTHKQTSVARAYALRPAPAAAVLEICEHTSFDLDKKVWDSGVGLSAWLVQLAPGTHAELRHALLGPAPRHIVELGAGTGIVAITLGILRAALPIPAGDPGLILATDLPSAMPLLRHNIASNVALTGTAAPVPAPLDWHDPQLPDALTALTKGLDAIVMADVTYNAASFPALVRTLSRLVDLSRAKRGGPAPIVLLAYKQRDPAERALWHTASQAGIHLEQVDQLDGAGGEPVEIWMGKLV